eukprot:324555_1
MDQALIPTDNLKNNISKFKKCFVNLYEIRLWVLRAFVLYELILVIIIKYIKHEFYRRNIDELSESQALKTVIVIQAPCNFIFLLYFVICCWEKLIWTHLCDSEKLLYPMFMIGALIFSDILIAFDDPDANWIYFLQVFCDLDYIIFLLFIVMFEERKEKYMSQDFPHDCWNKFILSIDVFTAAVMLYIVFSLFLFMIFEDWNIENSIEHLDNKTPTVFNIMMENFLIFEWVHQFLEYVFLHSHTSSHNSENHQKKAGIPDYVDSSIDDNVQSKAEDTQENVESVENSSVIHTDISNKQKQQIFEENSLIDQEAKNHSSVDENSPSNVDENSFQDDGINAQISESIDSDNDDKKKSQIDTQETNLTLCQGFGVFTFFAVFQLFFIQIRIRIEEHYLYDFDFASIVRWWNDSASVYIFFCIAQVVVTGIFLVFIIIQLLTDKDYRKVMQIRYKMLTFA